MISITQRRIDKTLDRIIGGIVRLGGFIVEGVYCNRAQHSNDIYYTIKFYHKSEEEIRKKHPRLKEQYSTIQYWPGKFLRREDIFNLSIVKYVQDGSVDFILFRDDIAPSVEIRIDKYHDNIIKIDIKGITSIGQIKDILYKLYEREIMTRYGWWGRPCE